MGVQPDSDDDEEETAGASTENSEDPKATMEAFEALESAVAAEETEIGGGEETAAESRPATGAMAAQVAQQTRRQRLFEGLTFYLSRETPQEPLEFLVLSCGGRAILEVTGGEKTKNRKITHWIVDRPKLKEETAEGVKVQPQWVFDSVNEAVLLPVPPYAPGQPPPPHLSPFVSDAAEGYTPHQRDVLEAWKEGRQAPTAAAGVKDESDVEMESESEDEEGEFEQELARERRGESSTGSAAAAALAQGEPLSDIDSDQEDSSDDDDDDEDQDREDAKASAMAAASDSESEEEPPVVVVEKSSKKKKRKN
eukprot:GABV01000918.1.p1 GENE.GABV01000918.1~~GABV01000918.1.p1  ORF type:complete len:324 (+),score=136.97 GABV01000918.1:43-972(+)